MIVSQAEDACILSSAIQLLDVCPREALAHVCKEMRTRMLIKANFVMFKSLFLLFKNSKNWKEY